VTDSIKLVAFDLDGTLLRGDTVCEVIARELGKLDRMREFERYTSREDIAGGRREMAGWYDATDDMTLLSYLPKASTAPGVSETFDLLRRIGIKTAIVSITWDFAVEWFARRFGADFSIGTEYVPGGEGVGFWPEDKPTFVDRTAHALGIGMDQVAAVGDSSGDVPMLRAVGRSAFVGSVLPEAFTPDIHAPGGDILRIVKGLIGHSDVAQ
jgi:phosphoserine phosphatase